MRFTIEILNSYRAENGFSPVFGLSQRAINQQCKEWEASSAPRRIDMSGGYASTGADHDDYNRQYGN